MIKDCSFFCSSLQSRTNFSHHFNRFLVDIFLRKERFILKMGKRFQHWLHHFLNQTKITTKNYRISQHLWIWFGQLTTMDEKHQKRKNQRRNTFHFLSTILQFVKLREVKEANLFKIAKKVNSSQEVTQLFFCLMICVTILSFPLLKNKEGRPNFDSIWPPP